MSLKFIVINIGFLILLLISFYQERIRVGVERMKEPIIELKSLSKDYGSIQALNNVSLTVYRGEIFGYIGGNGAGKSTTLKILAGIIKPSSGDAIIDGHSLLSAPLEVKAKIGFVPETGAIFEKLTAREYLTIIGQLYKLPNDLLVARINEWMQFFRISERIDQRMEIFSKGTKQKICIIAALLHDPELLLLDEPLTGLDSEAVVLMKDLLKRLSAMNKTIFYTSHLLDIVEKICSRIAVLHKGNIINLGTINEICTSANADNLESALIGMWQNNS